MPTTPQKNTVKKPNSKSDKKSHMFWYYFEKHYDTLKILGETEEEEYHRFYKEQAEIDDMDYQREYDREYDREYS